MFLKAPSSILPTANWFLPDDYCLLQSAYCIFCLRRATFSKVA
jgi:hypothetical protein